jgi:hypothetical protein
MIFSARPLRGTPVFRWKSTIKVISKEVPFFG